jgi:hypothetical protein
MVSVALTFHSYGALTMNDIFDALFAMFAGFLALLVVVFTLSAMVDSYEASQANKAEQARVAKQQACDDARFAAINAYMKATGKKDFSFETLAHIQRNISACQ